ncbi:MAG: hypothetical protein GF416_09460 [Candidatus Altiarchaeales archaeon]|nr:hypothetical protein [Candidatus Altiarchaeales archaeon]MBD3417346.1 hypothetical protein [Candidatus Altiarchaeales archaeon]
MNPLLMLATTAIATATPKDGGMDLSTLGLVGFVFGILALLYTYNLTQTRDGLEKQIRQKKRALMRVSAELKEVNAELKARRGDLDSILSSEVEKIDKVTANKPMSDGIKRGHWDRLGEMERTSTGEGSELGRLEEEREEIERMIEATRDKYHKRMLDEKSFSNITQDYQKKLIELETKIKKRKGEGKK